MKKNEVINKIQEYGFFQPLDYPGEAVVLHKIDGDYPVYVGYILNPYVIPCTWDYEGNCYIHGSGWEEQYNLLIDKPEIKWYTDPNKFPALIKYRDSSEFFLVSKFNGKDRLKIKDSMKYVHKDRVEYIQTINSNYISLLKLEKEIDQTKSKELHNLKCDCNDLHQMVNVYRCPCCEHLVQKGIICGTCGYNNCTGYTNEELKQMASKSQRI